MTTSPGQPPRDQDAPPREFAGRLHRTGYLALAASGLALCTAFAAVAQIIQPETTELTPTTQTGRSTGGGGPTELVPGQAVPAEATVVIDGVAVTGEMPSSSGSPTTIITTDENGNRRTTVHTPSQQGPTRNSPGNGGDSGNDGDEDERPNPKPTDNKPGPQPSDPPGDGTTPPDNGGGTTDPGDDDSSTDPGDGGTGDGDSPPPTSSENNTGGGSSTSAAPTSTTLTTTSRADLTTSPSLSGTTTTAH